MRMNKKHLQKKKNPICNNSSITFFSGAGISQFKTRMVWYVWKVNRLAKSIFWALECHRSSFSRTGLLHSTSVNVEQRNWVKEAYVMHVSRKDSLLKRTYVVSQESEPLTIHAYLAHVNVASRYIFITAFQTWILPSIRSY